jgi:cell division protein FtsW
MGGKVDRPLVIAVLVLVILGFFIFSSASLALLLRDGVQFSDVAFTQLVFGIGLGLVAMYLTSRIKYQFWRKHAFRFVLLAIAVTLLVFIPAIGVESGGASRWIKIAGFTFQPVELLKLGVVVYLAAWFSSAQVRARMHKPMYGIIPLIIILSIIGILLLLQPDTGSLAVIILAATAIYVTAGARLRDLAILTGVGTVALALLALVKPYIKIRLFTFLNPAADPLGAGYQIQQSLISIGSGGWFGRGYGQSIQKFDYLPEPIGDSIFAVYAEEFGLIGSFLLIAIFVFLAHRGLQIARRAPDDFGRLLVVGIVILIVSQSFINIASMLGIFPLTGLPLLFISHGGSALLIALAEIGIVLNVSRYLTAGIAK